MLTEGASALDTLLHGIEADCLEQPYTHNSACTSMKAVQLTRTQANPGHVTPAGAQAQTNWLPACTWWVSGPSTYVMQQPSQSKHVMERAMYDQNTSTRVLSVGNCTAADGVKLDI